MTIPEALRQPKPVADYLYLGPYNECCIQPDSLQVLTDRCTGCFRWATGSIFGSEGQRRYYCSFTARTRTFWCYSHTAKAWSILTNTYYSCMTWPEKTVLLYTEMKRRGSQLSCSFSCAKFDIFWSYPISTFTNATYLPDFHGGRLFLQRQCRQ